MNGPAVEPKQWIKKTKPERRRFMCLKKTLQSSLAWGRKLRLAEIRGALRCGPWGYEPGAEEFGVSG